MRIRPEDEGSPDSSTVLQQNLSGTAAFIFSVFQDRLPVNIDVDNPLRLCVGLLRIDTDVCKVENGQVCLITRAEETTVRDPVALCGLAGHLVHDVLRRDSVTLREDEKLREGLEGRNILKAFLHNPGIVMNTDRSSVISRCTISSL